MIDEFEKESAFRENDTAHLERAFFDLFLAGFMKMGVLRFSDKSLSYLVDFSFAGNPLLNGSANTPLTGYVGG